MYIAIASFWGLCPQTPYFRDPLLCSDPSQKILDLPLVFTDCGNWGCIGLECCGYFFQNINFIVSLSMMFN